MENQNDNTNAETDLSKQTSCVDIRPVSPCSESGSDDNGEDPPFSFSIHTELPSQQQQSEKPNDLNSLHIAFEDKEPFQDGNSELEDEEQPPVTWFVTKPRVADQATYTHAPPLYYHGIDMAAPQSHLCKLCLVRRKKFYCIKCVNRGEFSHSDARSPGNLSERKDQLSVIEKKKQDMINEIKKKTDKKLKCQELEEDIRMSRQRINYLQKIIQSTKDKRDRTQKHAKKLEAMNDTREQRLPIFIDKASKIRQYTNKYVRELDKEKVRVCEKYRVLDIHRQNHIRTLFELVFPVEKVVINSTNNTKTQSSISTSTTDGNESAVIESLMAEAMSTSYVHGQGWVSLSSDFECPSSTSSTLRNSSDSSEQICKDEVDRIVYKIVAPYLPADGDYSRFPTMVKAANDQIQSIIPQQNQTMFTTEIISSRGQSLGFDLSADDEISSIHTISAALTLTAQLVSQISTYLDVILPKYFSGNEFGVPTSSDYKFAKKVARLNLNIIFLCLTVGVPPEDILPTQSLHNLYLLYTNTRNNKHPSNIPALKAKVAENLYALNMQNTSALEKFSPTNDDLSNDSDDNGKDDEKLQKDMEDWEAISLGVVEGSSDMMVVNLSQFNAAYNTSWILGTSPTSPVQSPGPYGVGNAANSATSFVSSIIRGFTGASSPTNTNTS